MAELWPQAVGRQIEFDASFVSKGVGGDAASKPSPFSVDNFVGKPLVGVETPHKIKAAYRLLNSCAGKFGLKFNCLLICDSTVKLSIGLFTSIGLAVDFSACADLGWADD